MSLEKPWHFDINRVHPELSTTLRMSQWQLWYMAESLLGNVGGHTLGLWTVYTSCDGVTAGADGDGIDRWGAGTFDASKMVKAIAGSAHSWMVLKSPDFGGGDFYYLILELSFTTNPTTLADSQYIAVICKTAPTGGSTLNRPTSTQQALCEVANNAAFLNSGNINPQKVHSGLTTDGKQFYMLMSRDNSGTFQFGMSFAYLQNTKTTDDFKMVLLSIVDETYGCWTMSNVGTLASVSATVVSKVSAGAAQQSSYFVMSPGMIMTSSQSGNFTSTSGTAGDTADGTQYDWPAWLCSTNSISLNTFSGTWTIKGRFGDFGVGPDILGDGSSAPATGPVDHMLVGAIWVPTDTIPSL